VNLLRAVSTVSGLTLASRVTGLVRDLLIANQFGASAAADAFHVAFRIPNLLRRLFAEGAFAQAFVPLLARSRAADGDEATRGLISAVATVLAWALVAISAVGVVAAPVLVWAMASGLQAFELGVLLTRLMFPYIGFVSLVALAAAVLNTWKRFAVPAVAPVLLNLSLIVAAAWAAPWIREQGGEPVLALAAGVMLGGMLQLAVQIPALARLGLLPRIGATPSAVAAAWRHPGVRRLLALMAPALLGVSVAQLSLLINTQIASHLGVGAVSWIVYADRLMEFPTALLGVALGVVLTPQLAAALGEGDVGRYEDLLDWGLRLVLVLALPCAVALAMFAEPMVATLFHHGAFTARDVEQTSAALRGYGLGLLGLVAIKILAPGFYARQDMKTPVRIAVLVLVVTQLLNAVLVPVLGAQALTLSISLAALLNAALLLLGLRRAGAYHPQPGWWLLAARVLVASLVLAGGLAWAAEHLPWLAWQARPWMRAACLGGVIAAGAGAYLLVLALVGLRWRSFMRRG
jgi:putative peptidoglycan lipid II flippase